MSSNQQSHLQRKMSSKVGGVYFREGAEGGESEEGTGVRKVRGQERENLGGEGGEGADEGDKGLSTRFLKREKTEYSLI